MINILLPVCLLSAVCLLSVYCLYAVACLSAVCLPSVCLSVRCLSAAVVDPARTFLGVGGTSNVARGGSGQAEPPLEKLLPTLKSTQNGKKRKIAYPGYWTGKV